MENVGDNSLVRELRGCAGTHLKELEARLDALNESIRLDGGNDGAKPTIRFSALARLMLYVALDRSEATRGSKGKLKPQWSTLIAEHNEMCDAVGFGVFKKMPSDDGLASFCRFATRRTGNHVSRFYAGLAAYAVLLEETSRLDSPFLQMIRPACETRLPQDARVEFDRILADSTVGGSIREKRQDRPDAELTLSFPYRRRNIDRFEEFRSTYSNPVDGRARFVVYRPSRSSPNRLMKSFLAISGRAVDTRGNESPPDAIHFAHIYASPDNLNVKNIRHTRGRVVPLDDGVYLIGAQREARSPDSAMKALKVIALPWLALDRRHGVLRALVLSANYGDKQLVTKATLRATPIARSTDLKIGFVAAGELWEDLQADAEAEEKALGIAGGSQIMAEDSWKGQFPLWVNGHPPEGFLREQADQILDLCNNTPAWDVGSGFVEATGRGRNRRPLTRAGVEAKLEAEFGTRGAARYARHRKDSGKEVQEEFSFWQSMRFGPISND